MRVPRSPPKTEDLVKKRLAEWLAASGTEQLCDHVQRANEQYWNWDELRAHPIKELPAEVAWLAVKLARRYARRRLGFADTAGSNFWFSLHGPALTELHLIDLEREGTLEGYDEDPGSKDRTRFMLRACGEEAIASSRLEGAATTREVAKDMLHTGRKPENVGEQMILNNYQTIQWLREHRDRPLTKSLVFETHRRITEDTLKDRSAAGRFRTEGEQIYVVDDRDGEVMHIPPPARQLEERMARLCDFANAPDSSGEFMHPVIRAIILHFWLAYDHPFVDGNGRTARALFYWCMLRRGYWLFEFLSVSRIIANAPSKYVRAFLNTERDEADLSYFIVFHLRVIQRARKELRDYLGTQRERQRELLGMLKSHPSFNHRQRALLSHAIRHENLVYTIDSHRRAQGVAFETARTDLAALARSGLLVEYKVGKRFHYAVPPDLRARLGLPPQ